MCNWSKLIILTVKAKSNLTIVRNKCADYILYLKTPPAVAIFSFCCTMSDVAAEPKRVEKGSAADFSYLAVGGAQQQLMSVRFRFNLGTRGRQHCNLAWGSLISARRSLEETERPENEQNSLFAHASATSNSFRKQLSKQKINNQKYKVKNIRNLNCSGLFEFSGEIWLKFCAPINFSAYNDVNWGWHRAAEF